jgi:hypothetical protein
MIALTLSPVIYQRLDTRLYVCGLSWFPRSETVKVSCLLSLAPLLVGEKQPTTARYGGDDTGKGNTFTVSLRGNEKEHGNEKNRLAYDTGIVMSAGLE